MGAGAEPFQPTVDRLQQHNIVRTAKATTVAQTTLTSYTRGRAARAAASMMMVNTLYLTSDTFNSSCAVGLSHSIAVPQAFLAIWPIRKSLRPLGPKHDSAPLLPQTSRLVSWEYSSNSSFVEATQMLTLIPGSSRLSDDSPFAQPSQL